MCPTVSRLWRVYTRSILAATTLARIFTLIVSRNFTPQRFHYFSSFLYSTFSFTVSDGCACRCESRVPIVNRNIEKLQRTMGNDKYAHVNDNFVQTNSQNNPEIIFFFSNLFTG